MSVLMPVRNGGSALRSALLDLVSSLGSIDEIVVVDEGIQDQTPSLLEEMATIDSRIRVITSGGIGLVDALNLGFRGGAIA